MTRRELWKLLAQGPAEYHSLVMGALQHRFGLLQINPGRRLGGLRTIDALDDRWVAIVRDHGVDLRGPRAFSHTVLHRLAQRATYAVSIDDGWKLHRDLACAAEMGARVLVIENDMDCAAFDEWEDFLDEHVPGRVERCRIYPHTVKKLRELEAARRCENVTEIVMP